MKRYIGLDLGSSTFKAVVFTPKSDKFLLSHAYVLPYPANSMIDGSILDFSEVSQQIGKLIESGAFNKAPLAVAIKGSVIAAKSVKVPFLSREQLRHDMPFMAEQYIRTDPEEFSTDYKVIRINKNTSTALIALATIRKDNLADYVSVIESAQHEVGTVDAEALALADLYTQMKLPTSGLSLILHIGHTTTLIIFIKDGNFSHYETHSIAGEHCDKLLMNELKLAEDVAESAKITPDSAADPEAVKKIIDEKFSPEFILHVESALANHSLSGGSPLTNIYLSGGGATTYNLYVKLKEKFEVPVNLMNPTSIIEVTSSIAKQVLELKPAALNVAIAMALR